MPTSSCLTQPCEGSLVRGGRFALRDAFCDAPTISLEPIHRRSGTLRGVRLRYHAFSWRELLVRCVDPKHLDLGSWTGLEGSLACSTWSCAPPMMPQGCRRYGIILLRATVYIWTTLVVEAFADLDPPATFSVRCVHPVYNPHQHGRCHNQTSGQ